MVRIVVNSKNFMLYIIEHGEHGEEVMRELAEEDIAKLSKHQQAVVSHLQQQAWLMQELARMQEQAALAVEKTDYFCDINRELRHEAKEWAQQGWGYKPKLNPAARKPYRAKPYWHRTRSFCVRKGYH